MITSQPFNHRIIKVVDSSTKVPVKLVKKVDEYWLNAIEQSSYALFNEKKLSVKEVNATEIIVQPIDYKFFYAQNKNKRLAKELSINLLAVSGALLCKEGIVFGLRRNTTQANDQWELAPSGSVDYSMVRDNGHVNFNEQILTELEEETGISENNIDSAYNAALIFDDIEKVYDIAIILKTQLTFNEITDLFKTHNKQEYKSLKLVKPSEIESFMAQHQVIPVSKEILTYIKCQ